MNSMWTVTLLTVIYLILYVGKIEGKCDKCKNRVLEKGKERPGALVSHSHVNDQCYGKEKEECEEGGIKYTLRKNRGYPGGSVREEKGEGRSWSVRESTCPETEWICERKEKGRAEFGGVREEWGTYGKTRPEMKENLFIDLATRIATSLNVSDCWVCGGPHMSEQWPWIGESLSVWELLAHDWDKKRTGRTQEWKLTNYPEGQVCVERKGKVKVGESPCQSIKLAKTKNNATWWPEEPTWYITKGAKDNCTAMGNNSGIWNCSGHNPYEGIPSVWKAWRKARKGGFVPEGLFWICGNQAYTKLPKGWGGVCFLGLRRPEFFLLPQDEDRELGIKLFDSLRREKREIKVGEWGDEWPPARIIEYYGPATWAQDGSWGYRTPVYMLNRIIRLQAVVEVITNQTALALELLAEQQSQMRTAIYQNRLALDYLLASEGGVCGKFNLTNCCLKINDNGKAVLKISDKIRKLAHVPVQTWRSLGNLSWLDSLLGGSWWRIALLILGGILIMIIILPCLIPCLRALITRVIVQVMQPGNPADPAKMLLQRGRELEEWNPWTNP
ncbi:endogenous retrovirus group 3 member 1 Env polyprotein-like [Hemitrygon akajei]|uniref:endogenous retrovirus group 3 member 1 Env polyprotein-like n=1 Tax=Hemitrygon akajei TaxID=2704970 RepID=UPI003BF979CD